MIISPNYDMVHKSWVIILQVIVRGGYRSCESCDSTMSNCLIYIKLGNMVRKSEKIGTFTKSVLVLYPPLIFISIFCELGFILCG